MERRQRARYCLHCSGVSQDIGRGEASKTRDQENAAAVLGDSEKLSIEHSAESQITKLGKGPDDLLNVFAIVRREQRRDVFKNDPSGPQLAKNSDNFEEQAGLVAAQSGLTACTAATHLRDVRAGEPRCDAVHRRERSSSDRSYIFKPAGVRKSVSKDSPRDGIDFDLPGRAPSSALESKIKAADSGKEASDLRAVVCLFARTAHCAPVVASTPSARPFTNEAANRSERAFAAASLLSTCMDSLGMSTV